MPVPVNEDLLSQMLGMGFSDVRARKGLVNGSTLEGAIAWLEQVSHPIPSHPIASHLHPHAPTTCYRRSTRHNPDTPRHPILPARVSHQHENDPDIDQPYMVRKVRERVGDMI